MALVLCIQMNLVSSNVYHFYCQRTWFDVFFHKHSIGCQYMYLIRNYTDSIFWYLMQQPLKIWQTLVI